MTDLVLGIDPGLTGALAALRLDGSTVGAWLLPTTKGRKRELDGRALAQQVADLKPILVVVESVHSHPGQGIASAFAFGRAFGELLGVLKALSVPIELVTPQRWQKEILGLPSPNLDPKHRKGELKARSVAYCLRRFPSVSLVPPGCRKVHDGLADALGLAEFARRLVLGESLKRA